MFRPLSKLVRYKKCEKCGKIYPTIYKRSKYCEDCSRRKSNKLINVFKSPDQL